MNRNYIVSKSNKLITANYDLSLQEQKLILTLASMVQPQDVEFKEYKFKIKEFLKLLDINDQKKYTEIPKITKNLMKKVFEVKEGKDIVQLSWLSSARYKTGQGTVILKFSPDLKPYMLQLKEKFIRYKLNNILSLKSKYSLRLYEILKANQFKKYIHIELKELKKMLGVKGKSYNIYANFKNKSLLIARKELKEKTDISFEFEEIKTGRKVTSIKFYIHSNKKDSDDEISAAREIEPMKGQIDVKNYELTDQVNQVKFLYDIDLEDSDIHTLLKVADNDINKIKKAFEILDDYRKTHNVRSAMAFLISCITRNWPKGQSLKQTKPTSGFINFKQRDDEDYDWEEIERLEREHLERELQKQKSR